MFVKVPICGHLEVWIYLGNFDKNGAFTEILLKLIDLASLFWIRHRLNLSLLLQIFLFLDRHLLLDLVIAKVLVLEAKKLFLLGLLTRLIRLQRAYDILSARHRFMQRTPDLLRAHKWVFIRHFEALDNVLPADDLLVSVRKLEHLAR